MNPKIKIGIGALVAVLLVGGISYSLSSSSSEGESSTFKGSLASLASPAKSQPSANKQAAGKISSSSLQNIKPQPSTPLQAPAAQVQAPQAPVAQNVPVGPQDACPNIPQIQNFLPNFMAVDASGNCIASERGRLSYPFFEGNAFSKLHLGVGRGNGLMSSYLGYGEQIVVNDGPNTVASSDVTRVAGSNGALTQIDVTAQGMFTLTYNFTPGVRYDVYLFSGDEVVDSKTLHAVDLCPNLNGINYEVPWGKHLENGNCISDAPTLGGESASPVR